MNRIVLLVGILTMQFGTMYGESGSVHGVIRDASTGEPLVGVNVSLVELHAGGATDLDGKYLIRNVRPGTYVLRASMVGYNALSVTGVVVAANASVQFDLTLQQAAVATEEVVVTAERHVSTESGLLAVRKKAAAISDGVTMEQVKRTPDVTTGDALRRVTGVALVDSKFIFIRGITDRYNGTTLDGAGVATTESGKKSFSFDLLPANLIENTNVIKSTTPDLPGDITGGLVQLNTLDFPDHATGRLTFGGGLNTATTGRSYATSHAGSTDWLGFGASARAFPGYPAGKDISMSTDLTELAAKLPNNFAPSIARAVTAPNMSLALGDRLVLGDDDASPQLGYIASLSYRSGVQRTEHDVNDDALSRYYTGVNNDITVLWGAIANVSLKFSGTNKLSIRNSYSRTALDRVTLTDGYFADLDRDMKLVYINWSERSIYTGQLVGEHVLEGLGGLTLHWRASVSSALREEPDTKNVESDKTHGSSRAYEYSTNQRSWSDLNDRATTVGIDVGYSLAGMRLKFGGLVDQKNTAYRIAYLNIVADFGISQSLLTAPLSQVYAPENFGPKKWLLQSGSVASDTYTGEQSIDAGYLMTEISSELFGRPVRLTGGARAEQFTQTLYIPRTLLANGPEITSTLKKTDVLPSLNLTYEATEQANIRFAYSHSVNRPEFRERSTTTYFDFVKYELVGGDTSLQRAFIHNYDVRVEAFPAPGELLAVSFFRKVISNAIEEVLGFASTRTRVPFNAPGARNTGWELEARKSLGFLGGYLENISVLGNYTRVFSEVKSKKETSQGFVEVARPMEGVSPYVINVSLVLSDPSWGTSISVAYNRFGERLDAVSFQTDDIYEQARDLIDFAVSQPLFGGYEAKFTVKNLNGKDRVLTRSGKLYDRISAGTSFGLQVSLAL